MLVRKERVSKKNMFDSSYHHPTKGLAQAMLMCVTNCYSDAVIVLSLLLSLRLLLSQVFLLWLVTDVAFVVCYACGHL